MIAEKAGVDERTLGPFTRRYQYQHLERAPTRAETSPRAWAVTCWQQVAIGVLDHGGPCALSLLLSPFPITANPLPRRWVVFRDPTVQVLNEGRILHEAYSEFEVV